ncbi:MAG: radical SAM protein [Deltaproteobacteria bacterium]|nr:radical SAM protein [Deltaproteobacteria bacterium]
MVSLRDDDWMSRRKALHGRYLELGTVGDASRLSYLHGPETVWTEEEVAGLWQRAVCNPISRLPARNCIYIHVPFCKSICNFCNYDRLQPSSPMLLKTWMNRVMRSIDVLGPVVRPLTFDALYIGGGTPSVLPARMLRELLDKLDGSFSWHRKASRVLEFDPAVINRERLEVLAAHRFNRLSFGIETLDPEINQRHNRGRQSIETIARCFDDMRAVGISRVTCDFLLGLEGTTPEGMLDEMETVLHRFRPGCLDIFMLTPTQAYVDRHFGGSWDTIWAHLKRFETIVPPALPQLAARTGYVVRTGQGHHMTLERPDPLRWLNPLPLLRELLGVRRPQHHSYTALVSEARRPLNVLGLGRSARSIIFGTAAYSSRDPDDNPAKEGPADYAGNSIDAAGEARSFLVHVLRDNDTIDCREFHDIFGGDMREVIPQALAAWESEGTAHFEEKVLRFVPQDRRERIRSLMWLVPEEAIEYDLAHYDQIELSATGVAALVANLPLNTALGDGYRYHGQDGTRLLIATPHGEILRLRVAPGLEPSIPLRLVVENPTSAAEGNSDGRQRATAVLLAALVEHHRNAMRRSSTGMEPLRQSISS